MQLFRILNTRIHLTYSAGGGAHSLISVVSKLEFSVKIPGVWILNFPDCTCTIYSNSTNGK